MICSPNNTFKWRQHSWLDRSVPAEMSFKVEPFSFSFLLHVIWSLRAHHSCADIGGWRACWRDRWLKFAVVVSFIKSWTGSVLLNTRSRDVHPLSLLLLHHIILRAYRDVSMASRASPRPKQFWIKFNSFRKESSHSRVYIRSVYG